MTDKFAEAAGRGMGSAFVFALTAGLLTALTPCVYPMIPITISVFGGRGVSRRRSFGLALPYPLQQRLARVGGRGAGGVFLMGLVGGLIAAPCTGPPLAGILAFVATTRDAVHGFFLLVTYAVGIGVPFWAIAGFSMQLPRSGAWMEAVK